MQAIGYKETAACLQGLLSPEEAVFQIKQASRRYAKRQLTWFARRTDACRLYHDGPSALPVPEAALAAAKEFLK
jgi:tRNA dimethylallyltransferase